LERKHVIFHQSKKDHDQHIEYDANTAVFAAKTIENITHAVCGRGTEFAQQFNYQKGIQKFGEKGRKAAQDEFEHFHKRNCFDPIDVTLSEKKRAMKSLLFLTEKRDGRVKGRLVYNERQLESGFRKTTEHHQQRH
jgi:hypothetical protein